MPQSARGAERNKNTAVSRLCEWVKSQACFVRFVTPQTWRRRRSPGALEMAQADAAEAAVRQAEAEGLTLQPSDNNATGYRGV